MRDTFLATQELKVCEKFQVSSSKTVVATSLRLHIPKNETGETRGKPTD